MHLPSFSPDEDWYVEEAFEAAKRFRGTGMYVIAKEGESDGIIGITVKKYTFDKPQIFQQNALTYFEEHQASILDALCLGVIAEYPNILSVYDITEPDGSPEFPHLTSIEEVQRAIGIGNLHILHHSKDDAAYVGLECGCPWDEEHGLGVLMHKERVIQVGSADISFSGSRTIRIDNGTYTEEERIADAEREKKREQERLANIARWKLAEERKAQKKWWQFWKK